MLYIDQHCFNMTKQLMKHLGYKQYTGINTESLIKFISDSIKTLYKPDRHKLHSVHSLMA